MVWGLSDLTVAITVLNLGWAHRIYRRSDDAAHALEKAADGLALLAGVLAQLEVAQFESPRLLALQDGLKRDGVAPSAAIQKLARIVEYVNSRHSLFLRPLDLVTFWSTQLVFAAERWQKEFGPAIRGWLKAAGEFEALTMLAAYAYEHPHDVFAEFD